jgi:predicted ATPase
LEPAPQCVILYVVSRVTIRLLGGFAALVDGEPVPRAAWRLRKARELVKLLALAPDHRLHREQAMDVLWGDRDPAAAANNLNQAVHVARRALGASAIESRDGLLRLQAEVDADQFERAAADARRAGTPSAYRAALSVYGGELLPENRYDDWAEARRCDLADQREALQRELAEMGLDSGVSGLPGDASSFIGREDELTELQALLSRTQLLTLTGTGGVGKTRLALELARRAELSYPDGAALVELAAVANAGFVVDAVAAALDVRALPGRGPADALADFLASRSLLVVLDNCEHVLGACAALAERLLRAAPRLTILATSREPLHVPAENVFRVPSLDIPDPEAALGPAELLRYEAARLFVERAAAAAPGFEVDEENADDVARICFRLDGLPLALELAAARVGALGPASLAERLDDRFRLLRTGGRTAPTRQQTLEATLAWSHDLLASDERVLLRRLAVFAGGFELDAAEAVGPGEGLDARGVADVLGRLVEKSLVAADQQRRDLRYGLLETVRLYASERLEDAREVDVFAGRHAAWALALAESEQGSPRLDREAANLRAALDTLVAAAPADALRLCVALWPFWLRRIDLEEAHRRFADVLATVQEPTALRAEALLAGAAVALRSGRLPLGDEYVRESLAIARSSGDVRTQWRALHFLGVSAIASDDLEAAVSWFEQALEFAHHERLEAAAALCVYCLGVARWRLGDVARADAEQLVAEGVEGFRALAGSSELIPSPVSVAEIRSEDAAGTLRIVFEDTLQPFVEISSAQAIGYALATQAGIARERGDLARARELLEESAHLFLRDGDERGQADVLVRLGHLELAEGSVLAARSCLERALELRRGLRDRRGLGMALSGLGLVGTFARDFDHAEAQLAEARDLFRRAGDRWGLTGALWNTADLEIARGDLDAAEAALDEALTVLAETGRDLWIAQTTARLAETALLRGDRKRAERLLIEARDLHTAKHDELGAARVARRLRTLEAPPSEGKGRAGTTSRTRTTGRRSP